MIGKTNAVSGGKGDIVGEKLNLTLRTNQAEHSDLNGVNVVLRYADVEKEVVWNGKELTLSIPPYLDYTVAFGDVEGYKTPEVLSYTAVADNSRSAVVEYETEKVTVNVSADDESDVNGQIVTINGVEYAWMGEPISVKIPFGTEYSVSVNAKENYVVPQAQTFVAGEVSREVDMVYVYDPYVDLSRYDIYGNAIAQNTANCYVVKEAGKYMFPIAYGAAIKNGAANTAAYTNNGGANSHDFVNYLGNVIASPYVETDTAVQATSVQMSIADMDNAVSELEIVEGADCRYVRFKVNEVPDVGANAVVSVKDANGTIMWNWHIWLWKDSLATEEITNATNVKYQILPVNLGSKWDDGYVGSRIKNWFYQWGRAVPLLCPSAYDSTTNHLSHGSENFTSSDITSAIEYGIKNPATFFYNNDSPYNWFGKNADVFYNLWDASCKEIGNLDNNVEKTVYANSHPLIW